MFYLDASIGICAYNEEENIRQLLDALRSQKLTRHTIKEIYVVSSGSTDKTDEIVREYEKKDPRIRLLVQKTRKGKSSAINLFLRHATGEIIVLESADTLPQEETIQNLLDPFDDASVGMVGGRPIPVNDENTALGYIVHLVWRLHHELSLIKTKAGEIVAFRNIIESIAKDTAVDEAWIEALITAHGLKVVYAPEAVVANRGPETVADFIRQRKRIFLGHLHLRMKKSYSPITMDSVEVAKIFASILPRDPIRLSWALFGIILEVYSRIRAMIEFYVFGENPYAWDMCRTTKRLVK
ncbi:MAG: glycosyltransferase [Candidatus Altiarchaeota archaeon]